MLCIIFDISISLVTFLESVLDRMFGKLDVIQHPTRLLILKEQDFALVHGFGISILPQAGFWVHKT